MAVSLRDALADAIQQYAGAVWAVAQSNAEDSGWHELTATEAVKRERVAALLAQIPQVFEAREPDGH